MKIKKLIITTAFLLIISTSTISIPDFNSYQNSKIIMQDNEKNTLPQIPIIAHRGFSSLEIENTLNAVKLGLQSNCTSAVEIDIQLTKDNEIILFHDSKLNDKSINEYTLGELKQIQLTEKITDNLDEYLDTLFDYQSGNIARERMQILQNKKDTIPTLDEILEIHSYYPEKCLIIELKTNDDNKEELINKTYEKLKKYNSQNIIIQSSDYDALLEMKNKYPNLKYHLIINKNNYQHLHKYDFDGYGIRKSLINYKDINDLLKNNKQVSIWNINTYSEYENILNQLGDLKEDVSYITNYPDALRTWYNQITQKNPKIKTKK